MPNGFWVGVGGVAGALARYWLGALIARRWPTAFPFGTLAINVSGSFLLGLLAGLDAGRGAVPGAVRLAMGVGFLGAYTTFSTWSVETLALVQAGSYLSASAYTLGSVLAGLAGAWLGLTAGRAA